MNPEIARYDRERLRKPDSSDQGTIGHPLSVSILVSNVQRRAKKGSEFSRRPATPIDQPEVLRGAAHLPRASVREVINDAFKPVRLIAEDSFDHGLKQIWNMPKIADTWVSSTLEAERIPATEQPIFT
jgi:hypothetical protein